MKILISYFSRTGNTEQLARVIGATLEARGHSLEWETITPARPLFVDEGGCP